MAEFGTGQLFVPYQAKDNKLMALLTAQTSTTSGIVPTENAVSSEDTFANTGNIRARVTNGNAGTLTITVVTPFTTGGLALADLVVTLTTGVVKEIGVFSTSIYNDSGGLCTMQFDVTSGVTMALVTG